MTVIIKTAIGTTEILETEQWNCAIDKDTAPDILSYKVYNNVGKKMFSWKRKHIRKYLKTYSLEENKNETVVSE